MMATWIEKLREEMGDRVVLVGQKGHEHWGFKVGNVYEIVERQRIGRTYLGFSGEFIGNKGIQVFSPSGNYAWTFLPETPISLENK